MFVLHVTGIILCHRFSYICTVKPPQPVKQGDYTQTANCEWSLVCADSRTVSRMHLGECQLAGDKIITGTIYWEKVIKLPSLGTFPGAIQLTRRDVVQKSKPITVKRDSNSLSVFHCNTLASLRSGQKTKTF